MSKIASLFFFIATLLFGAQVSADETVLHIGFNDISSHFIIGNPPGWTSQDTKAPFDAKFVNAQGTHECYVIVNAYYDMTDEVDLVFDCIEATEALYGEEFHKNENCELVWFNATDNYACIVFTYVQESTKQYVVSFTNREQDGKYRGTVCLVMQANHSESQNQQEIISNNFALLKEIGPYIHFYGKS